MSAKKPEPIAHIVLSKEKSGNLEVIAANEKSMKVFVDVARCNPDYIKFNPGSSFAWVSSAYMEDEVINYIVQCLEDRGHKVLLKK